MLTGRSPARLCALLGLLVQPGLGSTRDPAASELFELHCAKCHGPDGSGS
jgi:hypothetical protein